MKKNKVISITLLIVAFSLGVAPITSASGSNVVEQSPNQSCSFLGNGIFKFFFRDILI